MEKLCRASTARIGVLVMSVLNSALGLQGQTKSAASGATASAGVLVVETDDGCRLVLDGQDQGILKPDEAKRISVKLGDHILKCTVEGVPDLVWRKVIEVENSDQVAALISLKALHIQYEEATAKLEKEKSKQTAPTGSIGATQSGAARSEGDSSPEQKGKEETMDDFFARFFGCGNGIGQVVAALGSATTFYLQTDPASPSVRIGGVAFPAGTKLKIKLLDSINSTVDKDHTPFRGSLVSPLTYQGRVVVPAGATVDGHLALLRNRAHPQGFRYELMVEHLGDRGKTYSVLATLRPSLLEDPNGQDAKAITIGSQGAKSADER